MSGDYIIPVHNRKYQAANGKAEAGHWAAISCILTNCVTHATH